LGDAPATGSDFFILTFKSLGVSEPADNSVTSAKIVDGAIVNADINASAAIAGTKIDTSTFTTGFTITNSAPTFNFVDSTSGNIGNPDYQIKVNGGDFSIIDTTNSSTRLRVNDDGHIDIGGNLDANGGVDTTDLNVSGTADLDVLVARTASISGSQPILNFTDTTSGNAGDPDYRLHLNGGVFSIQDTTNSNAIRLRVNTDGHVDVTGNLDVGAGLDVTGAITATGNLSITSTAPQIFLTDSNANSDYAIVVNTGQFRIRDETNSANRLAVNSDGHVDIYNRLDAQGGLEITGVTTTTGRVNIGDTQMSQNLLNVEDGTAAAIDIASHGSGGDTAYIGVKKSTGGGLTFGISNRDIIFKTGATYSNGTTFDSGTERMRIESTGNLQIARNKYIGTVASGQSSINIGTSGGAQIGFHHVNTNDDELRFYTHTSGSSHAERMRIDSDGDVFIGTTTVNPGLSYQTPGTMIRAGAGNYIAVSREQGTPAYFNRDNNTGTIVSFRYNGSERGTITTDGTVISVTGTSDYRLKENNVNISDGITRLKLLKPYRFNFKETPSKTIDGFFAHEVNSVVPEAVFGEKDAVVLKDSEDGTAKKDDPIYQQLDHSKLVPLLTAALQEAIGRIEALEAK
jgi:hypothetical protein